MTEMQPKHYLQIDQLQNGRWVLCWPDGERFIWQTYKTKSAAQRALNFYRH